MKYGEKQQLIAIWSAYSRKQEFGKTILGIFSSSQKEIIILFLTEWMKLQTMQVMPAGMNACSRFWGVRKFQIQEETERYSKALREVRNT